MTTAEHIDVLAPGSAEKERRSRRAPEAAILLVPIATVLGFAFLAPLAVVLYYSLYDDGLTLQAFTELARSALFLRVLSTSFEISLIAMLTSLLLGYPVALHLARQSPRHRAFLMILVLVPFWTSILVKSFAFTLILGNRGVINMALAWAFGDGARMPLLFNRAGVVIGMTHYLLPFAVFPILASLMALNPSLTKAARVMGAGPVRIFLRITLPLSMPGVIAAALMTLVISLGMLVTPALLGGKSDIMIANLIEHYTRETLEWNTAAASAIVLLLLCGFLLVILMRLRRDEPVI